MGPFAIIDDSFNTIISELSQAWFRYRSLFTWLIAGTTTIQMGIILVKMGMGIKMEENPMQVILKIALWWAVVFSFPEIMNTVRWTFIRLGVIGSGGMMITDPSSILSVGWKVANPILEAVTTATNGSVETASGWWIGAMEKLDNFGQAVSLLYRSLPKIIIGLILWVLVMACYSLILAQVFLAYVEFAIIAAIGSIFLPFGILKFTAWMPEKLIGSIIGHGVKLLLLNFIIGIGIHIFSTADILPQGATVADITYFQLIAVAVNTVIFAVLCMNVPAMASGILSGQPTLTSQALAQTAMAGSAAANIIKKMGSGAAKAAGSGARGAMTLAGGLTRAGGAAKTAASLTTGGIGKKLGAGAGALAGSAGKSLKTTAGNQMQKAWKNFTNPSSAKAQSGLAKMQQPSRMQKSTGFKDFAKRSAIEGGIDGKKHANKKNATKTGAA